MVNNVNNCISETLIQYINMLKYTNRQIFYIFGE